MLKNIAQNVAVAASSVTGYSILITGEDGIVLGSTMKDRIGTLHEASFQVIKTGKQVVHNEKQAKLLKGTESGTTLPITINNEVVGSIGIRGDSEEVLKYGLLVKMLAEVFLRDRLEAESNLITEQNHRKLLREIITYDERKDNGDVILSHAKLLGYNLQYNRIALIINIDCLNSEKQVPEELFSETNFRIIKRCFKNPQDIVIEINENRYVIFVFIGMQKECQITAQEIRLKCELLEENMKVSKCGIVKIGIGIKGSSIVTMRKAYLEADKAIEMARLHPDNNIIASEEIILEKIISSIPECCYSDLYIEKIEKIMMKKNSDEIMKLITCWCESKFNFNETARRMNVHKNTLSYRFERINALLGMNIKNFKEAMVLYILITIYNTKNSD